MQTIGNYLKSGREARNIKLSEVARSTKISKWYLDCLEKDEFDKIPGGPYIKGYIASYASFIGIKKDEILERYDSLQRNSADENEIQGHLPEVKKRQKLIRLSFGKKNLLILSIAVLILLAFGFNFFFFQNQTDIAAQSQDAQDSKIQPAPSPKIKQDETRLVSNESSVQSAKLKDFTKNRDDNFQKKQEAAGASHMTDLSKNEQLNPIGTEDESHPTYQDVTGLESLASLPSEQDAANNMRVMRAVAASDVINKNPAGLSDSFHWSMDKVYIWTMIECDRPPASIRHTYYFEGRKVNDVELKIKSPQWRTWSYKTLLKKRYIGQWRVDITSEGGELFQSVFFEVN